MMRSRHVRDLSSRLFVLGMTLLAGAGAGGCGASGPQDPSALLEQHFPALAPELLASAHVLAPNGARFLLGRAAKGGLDAELPRAATEPVRLRLGDGFEVRIRQESLAGAGVPAGGAVAYSHAGGTSYWVGTPFGVEEWLLLEPGLAYAEHVAAAWDVEGASLELRGEEVLVKDTSGRARFRVSAPRAFAEGGRPVPVRLAVRGERLELFVDGGGARVLVDPAWAPAGSLAAGRLHAAATFLDVDGRVLLTGGVDDDGLPIATTEIFSAKDGWLAAGNSVVARVDHALSTLESGHVLATGGRHAEGTGPWLGISNTAELYDPATKAWSETSSMMVSPRQNHTATLLDDGRVLIVGSFIYPELFEPVMGFFYQPQWGSEFARERHTATKLPSGDVLIAGGSGYDFDLSETELFHPLTDDLDEANPMTAARQQHSATLLADGRVLVAGGIERSFPAFKNGESEPLENDPYIIVHDSAEVFNPVQAQPVWQAVAPMKSARFGHTATLLPDGRVLVAGGLDDLRQLAPAEIYDPKTNLWTDAPQLERPRTGHTATRLADGGVLVAGGSDSFVIPETEIFDEALAPGCEGVTCTAGPCHLSATCVSTTGTCAYVSKPDGAPCEGGTCVAGGCVADPAQELPGGTGAGAATGAGSGAGAAGSSGAGGASGEEADDAGCAAAPGAARANVSGVALWITAGVWMRRARRGRRASRASRARLAVTRSTSS